MGGLGVIIKSNLNRVRLSCCWVVFGLGCDNKYLIGSQLFDEHSIYIVGYYNLN